MSPDIDEIKPISLLFLPEAAFFFRNETLARKVGFGFC